MSAYEIYLVEFDQFKRRYDEFKAKDIDNPIRYFVDSESYILYWTDVDNRTLCTERSKSGFSSRRERDQFEFDFIKKSTRLLAPLQTVGGERLVDTVELDLSMDFSDIEPIEFDTSKDFSDIEII